MADYVEIPLEICKTCLHLLANGEYSTDREEEQRANRDMLALWGNNTDHLALGGEELGFSWQTCDGCGSTLGGDRFTATALIPA